MNLVLTYSGVDIAGALIAPTVPLIDASRETALLRFRQACRDAWEQQQREFTLWGHTFHVHNFARRIDAARATFMAHVAQQKRLPLPDMLRDAQGDWVVFRNMPKLRDLETWFADARALVA